MKVSVVIPAYNEEATINELIDKVISVDLPLAMEKEIVIVNDGSTDQTAQCLDFYATNPKVKVVHQSPNAGKTRALVVGMQAALGDIILIQDADLEYSPDDYQKLLTPILAEDMLVVYGSRFKGSIVGMTWINRMANIVSNLTFTLLYGVRLTDINTCYKVFKKEALDGITIVSQQFTFETEITAKFLRKGYKILEVPISYKARSSQEGKKIRWGSALKMYWGIIKFRFNC